MTGIQQESYMAGLMPKLIGNRNESEIMQNTFEIEASTLQYNAVSHSTSVTKHSEAEGRLGNA